MAEETAAEGYVPYKSRPEWKDITPIPQDDGPNPVVSIAYSEKFRDVYDYVRAVMQRDEMSERAFALTADAIDCNPANYSVCYCFYLTSQFALSQKLVQALGKDLKEELKFTVSVLREQAKNYQVWYHRQKLVELLGDPTEELAVTREVLREDSKNYHAWQHRQWAMATYQRWEGELEFVEQLIREDMRNNSAWNQRYFVVTRTSSLTDEVVKREVDYTLENISKAPTMKVLGIILKEFSKGGGIRSPFLLGLMVAICEEEIADGGPKAAECRSKAGELCNSLASTVDTIRKNYWDYVQRRVDQTYQATLPTVA
eukprot:Em0013g330a